MHESQAAFSAINTMEGVVAVVAVAAAAVAGIVRTKTLRYQYFHNYIIFEGMRMFCGILLYHYECKY